MGRQPAFDIFTTCLPPVPSAQPCSCKSLIARFWFNVGSKCSLGGLGTLTAGPDVADCARARCGMPHAHALGSVLALEVGLDVVHRRARRLVLALDDVGDGGAGEDGSGGCGGVG